MKMKLVLLTILLTCIFASQASAVADLYVNGVFQAPTTSQYSDAFFGTASTTWEISLIAEITPHADKNTLGFYTDLGTGLDRTVIFDDNDSPLHKTTSDFGGTPIIGFYLHNDLNDDGIFNDNDVMLFSERGLSLPNPPGSDYQWFMGYNIFNGTYSHFQFGSLEFWGHYDVLLFIDDDHVTGPNWDHNDMVVGLTIVPEPGTLILLGLGLAGAGLIRRKKS